jgi:hypothetical protein
MMPIFQHRVEAPQNGLRCRIELMMVSEHDDRVIAFVLYSCSVILTA